jgi:carbon-monoxide dehydrogenase medium subunit
MTLFRDIERDGRIKQEYPALAQAVSWLANPQIRNVATIGGNLVNAAPSADCAPPLMVMESDLILEGPAGQREVPIDEFFKGPGETCMDPLEILTQIRVPSKENDTRMAFLKMVRVSQDIAVANAAALVVMDNKVCRKCRIAVGSVAPVPLRLKRVEECIEKEEIRPDLLEHVGNLVEQEVRPITDVRSSEKYRRIVSGVLVKRVIRQAVENT